MTWFRQHPDTSYKVPPAVTLNSSPKRGTVSMKGGVRKMTDTGLYADDAGIVDSPHASPL